MNASVENRSEERPGSIKKAPTSDSHGDRVFPSSHHDRSESYNEYPRRQNSYRSVDDEGGVEVVLAGHGITVLDESPSRPSQDQNVFRPPRPVRPRAVRAQGGPPAPPHVKSSGSYGYGAPPPPPPGYGHRAPYPVPYNPSGSFEDGSYHQQPTHYSPHVQYPPPGARHAEEVNVISPSHRGGHGGPPVAPRGERGSSSHYQYPPTSPVSRQEGPPAASPPRLKSYAMRREGPYSAAQRGRRHPEDGTFNPYPAPVTSGGDRPQPPLVTESSFDSDHYSSHQSYASHPTTPNAPHYGPPMHDARRGPYYGGGSFGSFDSHAAAPPPHFDDQRYYGHHAPQYPPESPYSQYSYNGYSPGGYSQGGYYDHHSPHPEYGRRPHSYEDDDYHGDRHHDDPDAVGSNGKGNKNSSMMLPKAASEIDFDVADPPLEPILPPSKIAMCDSPADINSYDVLCGRGGGTNSQVGNRRFRKLVQDFQPTYLLARRKEKPLLARTIVLIIRKRGGRFLKKDEESGELFEVGDSKAEAKTSQALREGLDVRATKSAASSIPDKKKKKGKGVKDESDAETNEEEENSIASPTRSAPEDAIEKPTESPESSPPVLPKLSAEEQRPVVRVPSPQQMQFRKRRRMRSGDNNISAGCFGGFQDKLFSEFCPPRENIARANSPPPACGSLIDSMRGSRTPTRRNQKMEVDDDDIRYETDNNTTSSSAGGCAGIALDIVTGAAVGSFCLGPRKWR
jgi:hypothetical protein